MKGVRAFGRNEGGLNHTGDFVLLFSPLLPHLADAAVFSPHLSFSPLYAADAPDNFEEILDGLGQELLALQLPAPPKESQTSPYYGPGFFPRFATYVVDDWNSLLCFKKPFPDWQRVFDVVYSKEQAKAHKTGDYGRFRAQHESLGFFLFFRNIDACFWECYSADPALIDILREHLKTNSLDYEDLEFAQDFPFGGLKQKRKFKNVYQIWPPEKDTP